MDWPERWKGKAPTHCMAHRNVYVTNKHRELGHREWDRVVFKGKEANNPDTKYVNYEFTLVFLQKLTSI